jgi:hypothetical protein
MGGLNPRALATLGIGYGAALVARLGIWPDESQPAAGGGRVPLQPRDKKRRPQEEDEAFLIAALL